jgi:hypothetical protein
MNLEAVPRKGAARSCAERDGGWEPRLCAVCAERVTITAGGLWMRRLGSEPVALHHHCAPVWFAGLVAA